MNNKINSDEDLLLLLRQDDRSSFDQIYHSYANPLYQSAFKLLQDKEAAEDVVQEVLFELWTKRATLNIINLKAYLHQSTRFQAFKIIRHNKVIAKNLEKDFVFAFCANDGDHLLAQQDIRTLLKNTLDQLPKKCAEIFYLSRNEQLSHKEIAERLNISPKTVENQLNTALKKIKKAFSKLIVLFELIILLYLLL
ncbi:RNA polymerase sigma-70 factor [Pedobacter sp. AW31-3R]|uniref:RNA polymerase sigma-70 factor n=1 Tax=Pedobacter sp. AW31-3R TaxID=3445781 RepID=UPI003FA01C44